LFEASEGTVKVTGKAAADLLRGVAAIGEHQIHQIAPVEGGRRRAKLVDDVTQFIPEALVPGAKEPDEACLRGDLRQDSTGTTLRNVEPFGASHAGKKYSPAGLIPTGERAFW
jgi:hypothetical protein